MGSNAPLTKISDINNLQFACMYMQLAGLPGFSGLTSHAKSLALLHGQFPSQTVP